MDYLTTARNDAHQMLDVMVVGEALIDVVTTSHDTVEHPGGSPANVAYGLGRLGRHHRSAHSHRPGRAWDLHRKPSQQRRRHTSARIKIPHQNGIGHSNP